MKNLKLQVKTNCRNRVDPDKSLKIGIITEAEHEDFLEFTQKWLQLNDPVVLLDLKMSVNDSDISGIL